MKTDDGSIHNSTSHSKKRPKKAAKHSEWRWILSIFLATIVISGTFSFLSSRILSSVRLYAAFLVLFIIVAIGILFDIIGVAVTAAAEQPFHGMASRRVKGASEAIMLLRNASRVSSFCNDVIGDICGVISGSAAAAIAAETVRSLPGGLQTLIPLLLSALVAAFTVGGKAIGKSLAMRECTQIIFLAAKVIRFFRDIPAFFSGMFRKRIKKK